MEVTYISSFPNLVAQESKWKDAVCHFPLIFSFFLINKKLNTGMLTVWNTIFKWILQTKTILQRLIYFIKKKKSTLLDISVAAIT